jgi:hypothetical protein
VLFSGILFCIKTIAHNSIFVKKIYFLKIFDFTRICGKRKRPAAARKKPLGKMILLLWKRQPPPPRPGGSGKATREAERFSP